VDLQEACLLEEVRLFNRMDLEAVRARASRFALLVSDDGLTWREAFTKRTDAPFGGMDGQPFRWLPEEPRTARFLRIVLLAHDHLHLDQVEVYGRPAAEA
jgi:hypothetical protein